MKNAHVATFPSIALAMLLLAPLAPARAQQDGGAKPLDHGVYNDWMEIDDELLSPDGRWLAYSLVPGDEGDATLHVRSLTTDSEYAVPRGLDPEFDEGGAYVVFMIEPRADSVRQAKIDDVPSEEMPRDSLGILDLATGSVQRVPRVQSFRMPDERAGVVAYLLEEPVEKPDSADRAEGAAPGEPQKEPAAAGAAETGSDEEEEERDKPEGTVLVLLDLTTGEEHRYEHVAAYEFTEDGAWLAYAASSEDGDADGVYVVNVTTGEAAPVLAGAGIYQELEWDEEGEQLAFLTNRDAWQEEAEDPAFSLYRWEAGNDDAAGMVARAGTPGVPAGWRVSEYGNVDFSENGERLFFGTEPVPAPEPDEPEIPEDEKVVLDVWHWQDPYLQPMQLERVEEVRERSYLAVAHLDDDARIVQLATKTVPDVDVGDDGNADTALGSSNLPYRMLISWDWPRYRDIYLVNVENGERRLVLEKHQGYAVDLSPGAEYAYWYDNRERDWFTLDIESGDVVNATAEIEAPLWNVEHDRPYPAYPYGTAGWTEDDEALLVHDQYDIWAVDPTGEDAPRRITEGVGRSEHITFRRVRLDPELDAIDPDAPLLLHAFDDDTKASGFYGDRVAGTNPPEQRVMMARAFGYPDQAEDADRLLYTRESFREFPDLWVSGPSFTDMRRISNANPQQSEYRWGTAELVHWRSASGIPLDGILYKPDGFDPDRQYPMMVYFYERRSDGLHRHREPEPDGSSINITFYVSRGYVVFVPDIVYEIGFPGESAFECVVPGVLALIDQGFIDPERIGVQGHSWGGYQIAYMITRTDLFAAAEAGAPVSNMTSAYGGIRWGSGMSRMFQYEKTQSRIGETLWDGMRRYINNSPVFWAPKIETPLLMLHNDHDTAVPWEQGIELFVSMRRLRKPVWLLNYNGEPHGLPDYVDRKDWAIRMQQFFDHYLKGAPAPVWLAEGIPAVRKGETLGLELVEPTPATTTAAEDGGSRK